MYAEKRRKLIINEIQITCRLYCVQSKINKILYGRNAMDFKHLSHNCIFQKHDFLQIPTMGNAKATAAHVVRENKDPTAHHLLRSDVTNLT
jgi:hypothetical protein